MFVGNLNEFSLEGKSNTHEEELKLLMKLHAVVLYFTYSTTTNSVNIKQINKMGNRPLIAIFVNIFLQITSYLDNVNWI